MDQNGFLIAPPGGGGGSKPSGWRFCQKFKTLWKRQVRQAVDTIAPRCRCPVIRAPNAPWFINYFKYFKINRSKQTLAASYSRTYTAATTADKALYFATDIASAQSRPEGLFSAGKVLLCLSPRGVEGEYSAACWDRFVIHIDGKIDHIRSELDSG